MEKLFFFFSLFIIMRNMEKEEEEDEGEEEGSTIRSVPSSSSRWYAVGHIVGVGRGSRSIHATTVR